MAMRVRLRAPDEDADAFAASSTATANASATAWPSTHHRELHTLNTAPARRLPPLDVRSPDYIEERLENLKRKPTWRAFLDDYVRDHPDSESDDEDNGRNGSGRNQVLYCLSVCSASHTFVSNCLCVALGEWKDANMFVYMSLCIRWLTCDVKQRVEIDRAAKPKRNDRPGFLKTTLWSLVIVAFTPLLLLLYPCLRNRGNWPLGCTSLLGLILRAISTLVFILFGVALIYWTICRELPVLHANAWRTNLEVRLREMLQSAEVCQASIFQWDLALFQELCMPITIDVALLLLNVWLVFQSHQKWVRYALVLMAGLFFIDVPAKLYQATFPAPDIVQIDPSYALVDEELLIALEGKNLKPGGSVAWVAYWGCASTSSVDSCEKQFHGTFDMGVVPATFTSIDHFIPCYRDPPNPLKAQEFKCFEHIRLRVKDKQSIPGWSKAATPTQPQQQGNAGSLKNSDGITLSASAEQRIDPQAYSSGEESKTEKAQRTSSKKQQKNKRKGNVKTTTIGVGFDGEIAQQ